MKGLRLTVNEHPAHYEARAMLISNSGTTSRRPLTTGPVGYQWG